MGWNVPGGNQAGSRSVARHHRKQSKARIHPGRGDRGGEVESGYSNPFFGGTADRNVRPCFLTRWMMRFSRFDPCRDRALFCEAIRWWREARHRPANGCVLSGNMKAVLGALRLSGAHIPGKPPFLKGTKLVAGAWSVATPPVTGPKRALTPEGVTEAGKWRAGIPNRVLSEKADRNIRPPFERVPDRRRRSNAEAGCTV